MKLWNVGRRMLVLTAAACLFFCLGATVRSAQTWATREEILAGGSVSLVAAYPDGEQTAYYAMGTLPDRYLDAVTVDPQDAPEDMPQWNILPGEGGLCLCLDGLYLGCSGEEAYFSTSQEPYVWQLIQGENGTFQLHTGDGRAIGYNHNEGDGRFGVYRLSEAWDSQYRFDLLACIPGETGGAGEDPVTQPSVPEQADFPGGSGILWIKPWNVALCGEWDSSGFWTGTPVCLEQEDVTGYGPEDIWTVEVGPDNRLTLSCQGKTLSLGEDAVPVWDGPYSQWSAQAQEDGTWLICNAHREACYLGWNPMLGTWTAGALPETGMENYCFTFTPAEPEAVLPQAGAVDFSPQGGELYGAGGSEISLSTEIPGGEIYYCLSSDGVSYSGYTRYAQPICPETGFGTLYLKAYVSAPGYRDGPETVCRFTGRTGDYGFYFGQLHAHTSASDGLGTVEEAFAHAAGVENLDFLAVTDHSNSFDNDTLGALDQDGSGISQAWRAGKAAAQGVTNGEFVGIYGFEMTWNNGLGHISTFGTPGWASRNQEAYGNLHTALEAYYADLASVSGSVSQFNHPGALYGNFEEFAHYSLEADRAISLIEVFNSDVGDSFESYIQALDAGWHLAPTCNQDNHSGQWGSLDDGCTVVLAHTLTEESLLSALGDCRVYASQDCDLQILYTLDGNLMGTRLFDYGPEVTLQVTISDGTDGNTAFLEVIGSGGEVAAAQSINGFAELTLPSDSNYYLLRITQDDGDVAVTAPVWLEKEASLEITGFASSSRLVTAGEPETFTLEITNRASALAGAELTVTDGCGQILYSQRIGDLPGECASSWAFSHTFLQSGVQTITVTLAAGEKTVSRTLTVTAMPRSLISDVIVDGTHGAGVGAEQLIAVAEAAGYSAHVERNQITQEQLENCTLLIVPAPAADFEEAFTALVSDFLARGGRMLLCGTSDEAQPGTAGRMNTLLSTLGSTMTLSDDTVYDPASNGGSPDVLYLETINRESPWTAGIQEGQVYLHRAGCSVNPGNGAPLVEAGATAFSVDGDGNGLDCTGEVYTQLCLDDSDSPKTLTLHLVKPAGNLCLVAAEECAGGMVFLTGSGLPFDGNMQAEPDNAWDIPGANRTIFENILGSSLAQLQPAPISQVRSAEEGEIFLVEGWVTAGTANPHNRLPQTIYIQDETGGIALMPYSEPELALGSRVRVIGSVSHSGGDIHLELIQITLMEASKNLLAPEEMAPGKAMDYAASGGALVQVQGRVTAVEFTEDGLGVRGFTLVDDQGAAAQVLIETAIRSGTTGVNALAKTVAVGNRVQAAGLVYRMENTVLRVRNCDEVVLLWAPPEDSMELVSNGNPPTGDGFPLEGWLACMGLCLGAAAWMVRKKA